MTTQYLSVDGGRLAYSEHGSADGEPIFLLHGWMESRLNWKTTLDCLEGDYRCIAVDLMGFGESDKRKDGDYTIEAQARRVVALADALSLEKFRLIGHSMGGMISLYIAAKLTRERVISVVSLAGVVSGKLHPMTMNSSVRIARMPLWAMNAIANISRRWRHQKWWAYQQFKVSFYDFNAVPFDLWADWRDAIYLPDLDIPMKRAAEAILALDLTPNLKDITCPTLAIFGKQDHVVFPSDGQLVADHVPQGRAVFYDECGHFPNWEQREQYEADLMAFLHD